MKCDKCDKEIGRPNLPMPQRKAYQVRIGYEDTLNGDYGPEFVPDEDIGYYCSECLQKGV